MSLAVCSPGSMVLFQKSIQFGVPCVHGLYHSCSQIKWETPYTHPDCRSLRLGNFWTLCIYYKHSSKNICSEPRTCIWFQGISIKLYRVSQNYLRTNVYADVCKLLMDPAVAGPESRTQANSSESKALGADATAGHAIVCKLLMDPVVAGLKFRARVNSDNSWHFACGCQGRSRRCLQAADGSRVNGILK